jgi:hypothetical protein
VRTTRRRLLALAAALPLGGAVATRGAAGSRSGGRSDTELLDELVTHEHGLAAAYAAALRRRAIEPALGELLLAHERDHVRGLEQVLSGVGRRAPRATVPSPELTRALRSREAFASHAFKLETDALSAYSEALPQLRDAGLRRPLGSIMVCGGTHQIALRDVLGEPLLPRRS